MKDVKMTLTATEMVAENICKIKLSGEVEAVQAGQFVHVEVPHFTLRRPFCITEAGTDFITVIFAIVGAGTEALARLPVGTELACILPIGNGFTLADTDKKILVVGGGLGVAPLLPIFSNYPDRTYKVLLGFSSAKGIIEVDEFKAHTPDVTVATDDGSAGYAGRVTELVPAAIEEFQPDCMICCGPTPMLRALKALDRKVKTWVSTEARMGCGVGACLVCTCPVQHGEVVRNLRVCVDGPVFDLDELVL